MQKFLTEFNTLLNDGNALVIVIESTEENCRLLTPWLSQEEKARAAQYLQARDRRMSSVAHGCKRLLLSKILGLAPEELQFGTSGRGKPVCLNINSPRFNLSHSENWVALVLAKNDAVGIDIEFARPKEYAQLADTIFTADEHRQFKLHEAQEQYFLQCWSQKEAISKACGQGLYLDFTSINTYGNQKVNIDQVDYYFYSHKFHQGVISFATSNTPKYWPIKSFDEVKSELLL